MHVFEPRYHLMLEELDEGGFGVSWIIDGSEVGGGAAYASTGTLVDVVGTREIEDGRQILLLKGRSRFRLITTTDHKPYPTAQVEELDNELYSHDAAAELRDELSRRVARYMAVVAESGGSGQIDLEISAEPAQASYEVASLIGLTDPERQALLETDLIPRLKRVSDLIEKESDLLIQIIGKGTDGGA